MLAALDLASTRLVSPLQKLAIKFRPISDLSNLERFESFIKPPWLAIILYTILPRKKAISSAQQLSGPQILTDSSVRNGHIGISIHSPNIANFPVSLTKNVTSNTLNVFSGELLAIDVALAQIIHLSDTSLTISDL